MPERLSLLLADDEPIIRQKVSLMLGDVFSITQAETAEETRAALGRRWDIMLLDIVFPDGNGIDICREAKEKDPHVTVIVSSSLESVDAWNKAFQAGADDYLEKRELLALDPRKIILMMQNLVERNRLRKQAEETSRRQKELLSVLSHDVRAPFQAILGTIELLSRESISPDAAKDVEELRRCAKGQLSFINSLLDLLRLESGVTTLRTIKASVNLPVSQSIETLKIPAADKDIILRAQLSDKAPEIKADIGAVSRLINNLLSNAVKFTPRGGRISVTTSESSVEGVSGALIRVEDNGIGISKQDAEKVLQRFHRGREPGTEGETGAGLGLSICKEIVELHNGKMIIAPARTGGTLVTVWIPSADSECNNDRSDTLLGAKHGNIGAGMF